MQRDQAKICILSAFGEAPCEAGMGGVGLALKRSPGVSKYRLVPLVWIRCHANLKAMYRYIILLCRPIYIYIYIYHFTWPLHGFNICRNVCGRAAGDYRPENVCRPVFLTGKAFLFFNIFFKRWNIFCHLSFERVIAVTAQAFSFSFGNIDKVEVLSWLL